jgi:hypothetical protein
MITTSQLHHTIGKKKKNTGVDTSENQKYNLEKK